MRTKTSAMACILAIMVAGAAFAGSMDAPADPTSATSAMYTLESIYQRLATGAAGSKRVGPFAEPGAGPAATGHTLDQIMGLAPAVDNTNGAGLADVATGKKFWGLKSGAWGVQTGTGTIATVPASVPKTGQTGCWDAGGNLVTCAGTGQDGDKLKGVANPAPRFTDNSNGTVTDNLTGLIWLKNPNCANAKRNWATALTDVASLNSAGTMNGNSCGDTSNAGSHQTDWRLPNLRELQSLIDYRNSNPPLPSGYAGFFTGVQTYGYWSATTSAGYTTGAWYVYLSNGYVYYALKSSTYYVWPVR